MDRVVVSHKFADDFNKLPRSAVQLTANIRHAGKYTGMSMAEEGHLHHDVCTGQLNQNLSLSPVSALTFPPHQFITHLPSLFFNSAERLSQDADDKASRSTPSTSL